MHWITATILCVLVFGSMVLWSIWYFRRLYRREREAIATMDVHSLGIIEDRGRFAEMLEFDFHGFLPDWPRECFYNRALEAWEKRSGRKVFHVELLQAPQECLRAYAEVS